MAVKHTRTIGGILLAGAAGIAAYWLAIRPWHLRWGASDAELRRPLPGDERIPNPKLEATHAITIHAPAAAVWPWLAQMGQGRGGFYSYEWIEHLMGADIHNSHRIIPALQTLKVGDTMPFVEGDGPQVQAIEPGRFLLLGGTIDARSEGPMALKNAPPDAYFSVSWLFFLDPIDDQTTRLIERFKLDWNPSLQNTLAMRAFLEPGSFVMEQQMLRGIKERAERPTTPLLDAALPDADISIFARQVVAAPPEAVYAAIKRLDKLIAEEPVGQALGALRTLPELIARRLGQVRPAETTIDPLAGGPPFVVLAEAPGAEIVFGLVGRFWERDAAIAPVAPGDFAAFDQPGYAKTAFNLVVRPYGAGQSLLTSETRVATTDTTARVNFGRYWRLIGPGARLIMQQLLGRIKAAAEAQSAGHQGAGQ